MRNIERLADLFEIVFVFFLLVAPYNVVTTGNNMYPQEEQLMLTCSSEGGPQLEYSWLFEGSVIATSSILMIENVNATHGGEYTCNVTNRAGYNSSTITVYSKFEIHYFME